MKLKCPHCGTKTVELLECQICSSIGCIKCMKKVNKKLVCFDCSRQQLMPPYQETPSQQESEIGSALSSMFG